MWKGFLSASLFVLSSCNFYHPKDILNQIIEGGEKNVSYARFRAVVLEPHCLRCHRQGFPNGDFSTYKGLMATGFVSRGSPIQSRLWRALLEVRMPPGGPRLPQDVLATAQNWIREGAIEGDSPLPPPPQPPVFPPESYNWIESRILVPKCLTCHVDGGKGEGDFSSYEKLMNTGVVVPGDCYNSALWERTWNGSMPPPEEHQRLSDFEVECIEKWIDAGAPPPIK